VSGADGGRIERGWRRLEGMSEAEFADLEVFLVPWVRREYRRRRRDLAIIELAGCYISLGSGRAIARELSQDLQRFRNRPTPETGKRLLLASVLELNGGRPLRPTVIREVLAGKNREQPATNTAIIGV